MFKQLLQLEWKIFSRSQGQWLYPVLFLLLILCLFAFGVDPEPQTLQLMAPAILWCVYILALLLALDHLWQDDRKTGVLEQLVLNSDNKLFLLLMRTLIRWAYISLPLFLALPLAFLFLALPFSIFMVTCLSLLVGTLSFWLIGAALSALTLNQERSSLTSILLLPLCVPLVIFGSRAIAFSLEGLAVDSILLMLLGICVLTLCISPWVMQYSIKFNLD